MQISYLTYMEDPQNVPVWGTLPLPAIHQVLALSSFNFPWYSDLKKVNRNFNAHKYIHTHIHPSPQKGLVSIPIDPKKILFRIYGIPCNPCRRHKNLLTIKIGMILNLWWVFTRTYMYPILR